MRFSVSKILFCLAAAVVFSGCGVIPDGNLSLPSKNPVAPTSTPAKVFGSPDLGTITYAGAAFSLTGTGLHLPSGMACGGGYCYLVDSANHRVLIFSGLPTASSVPIGVLGQSSLSSSRFGPDHLNYPDAVFVSGAKLFIADSSNHRVLIYNSLPTSSNVTGDLVLGQANLQGSSDNRGTACAANSLSRPKSVFVNAGKLYVTDSGNHRVLVWNTIPTVNGTAADVVVGQANLTACQANRGGPASASTLSYPSRAILTSANKLAVTDSYNNRVLIFATPLAGSDAAENVVGQPDFTTTSSGTTQSKYYYPYGIAESAGALYVVDAANNRLMYYAAVPTSDGVNATSVIGQANFTSGASQCGTYPLTNSSCYRTDWWWVGDVTIVSNKLYVSDFARLMIYNTVPTANAAADEVFGQADFSRSQENRMASDIDAKGMMWPGSNAVCGDRLFVSDRDSSRVTVWNKNDPSAGPLYWIGQPTSTSASWNQGGAASATTLASPRGIACDDGWLYVSDNGNHRVLVYDLDLLATNMSATYVLGQANMTSTTSNRGGAAGSNTLAGPMSLQVYDRKLWVMDQSNNRVLVYNLPISANGPVADMVVGQPNFTTTTYIVNSQQALGQSFSISGGYVYSVLNRVLVAAIPAVSGYLSSVGLFGQPNYTSSSANRGGSVASDGIRSTEGNAITLNGKIYVADKDNSRILRLGMNPLPDATTSAEAIFGQASMTHDSYNNGHSMKLCNSGCTQPTSLSGVTYMSTDGDSVYISDTWNSRVLKISTSEFENLFNP